MLLLPLTTSPLTLPRININLLLNLIFLLRRGKDFLLGIDFRSFFRRRQYKLAFLESVDWERWDNRKMIILLR